MIEIKDKQACCGCHACVTVCAKHCITMQTDNEGFLYPVVDKENSFVVDTVKVLRTVSR